MANPNQITGRVTVTADGKKLASKEGGSLDFGGVSREAVTGDGGVLGYSEKTAVPAVEVTIAHSAGTNLKELSELANARVLFETDTGKKYVLHNAWLADAPKLSKGEVVLKFNAVKCEEM